MKILDQEQEIWLKDIKSIIQDTEKLLISINASETDLNALKTSSSQIDDLFLLVVVGEFNSGKSALINALLGEKILEEGVTPTTTQVNLLRFGSSLERKTLDENLYIIQAPIEFLTDISIVDTPGTNAIIRQHETITKEFIPRSDFVLFVTSADRPFTDSENNFLKIIKEWGKKIIVVVNKIDILESESDIERIKDFISDNIVSMLEISPEIFPISTRLAISGKNGNSEHWELSKFESVENYIAEQLDNKTKVKLKLLNPLGIIQNLINKHNVILNNRLDILKDDIDLINNIQKQIEIYEKDLEREFQYRLKDIDNIFFEMEHRGHEYFDQTLKLINIFGLLKKEEVKSSFEKIVIDDIPNQIEDKILDLIDWMVEQEFRQWKNILKLISLRQNNIPDKINSDPGSAALNYDRKRLIEDIQTSTSEIINTFDRKKEATNIANSAQEAVAATAALGAGAIGIGTIITSLTTTLAIDISGVILAGALAIIGVIIIPSRRKKINKTLSVKIQELRFQIASTLKSQFSKEITNSKNNILNAFMPYFNFITAENENLRNALQDFNTINTKTHQLKNKIDTLN